MGCGTGRPSKEASVDADLGPDSGWTVAEPRLRLWLDHCGPGLRLWLNLYRVRVQCTARTSLWCRPGMQADFLRIQARHAGQLPARPQAQYAGQLVWQNGRFGKSSYAEWPLSPQKTGLSGHARGSKTTTTGMGSRLRRCRLYVTRQPPGYRPRASATSRAQARASAMALTTSDEPVRASPAT